MSKQVGECKAMIVRISTARRMKHTHTHKRRRGGGGGGSGRRNQCIAMYEKEKEREIERERGALGSDTDTSPITGAVVRTPQTIGPATGQPAHERGGHTPVIRHCQSPHSATMAPPSIETEKTTPRCSANHNHFPKSQAHSPQNKGLGPKGERERERERKRKREREKERKRKREKEKKKKKKKTHTHTHTDRREGGQTLTS